MFWKVVDAVNKCPELSFKFPSNHEEQQRIVTGFKKKAKQILPGAAVVSMGFSFGWRGRRHCLAKKLSAA
jgi:hypothetical protein